MSPIKVASFFTARCFFLLPSRRERETEPRRTTSHPFVPLLSTALALYVKPWFVPLGCKIRDRPVISWAPAVSMSTSLITITLCYFSLAKSPLNGLGVNCGLATCVWMYVCVWNVGCEREWEIKDLFICANVTLTPGAFVLFCIWLCKVWKWTGASGRSCQTSKHTCEGAVTW